MAKEKDTKGTFTILSDEGKEVECEVLFTFDNEETGKSYIVYTDNTLDEEGNTNVFASVFDPTGKNLELQPVESDKEWKIIEVILSEIQDSIENKDSIIENEEDANASWEEDWYEKMQSEIKNAAEKNDITKLNSLADAVKKRVLLEKEIINIKKLFHLVDELQSCASWALSYSALGRDAYEINNYILAELAFQAANNPKNISASNDLAYIIRRGEIGDTAKYNSRDIVDLLKEGVQNKDAFSLINMALFWALKVGDLDSWELADNLIQMVSSDGLSSALNWWLSLAKKGDVEGELVHLWLLKHNKIQMTPLGTRRELLERVKKEIKLPAFFE